MAVNEKGNTVLKEGWAVKESGQAFLGKTNWKRRWCRLVKRPEGITTWSYYRKMEDIEANQPAGSIELDSTYVARELETKEEKNKPFCFALGPVFDNTAKRTYYVSCDNEEDKLSWMEVLSASIETDLFSSETFNENRRSVRSRMDRRTRKKRHQKTLSAPAQMSSKVLQVRDEYLNPSWRMEQWRCLCSVIKEAIWKKTDSKNGVTLSRLSFKHESYAVIKIEGCIPVPLEVTYDYLLTAVRPGGKFDQIFRNEEVLEVIEDSIPRASIVTNTYSLPMPSMSRRECCLLRCWIPSYLTKDNTCGLFVTSVNYPMHKPTKGSVRVQVQPSGFMLSTIENKDGSRHTLVSALGQIDLQDSLQSMLEATFKSGLLKIGLRTGFAHISNQIEKYYSLINR
ncbi:uncharacterized protein LOC116292680 isoform X2 [Actinia tenebrosa]|uniref:Uncharacterized protein LOC116292680 isoform X1 n=1 Tax=Actinia tenebrosa TaxID=6105 RepID=A0A6P8HJ71_ACTTE|nr:uncharacterized protein LOC116292680 isoform X1 [Actinia tenebrosa]XP_031555896.1 uncharacterized protein LOC116292680 isoform X2 [Actinia tenebrosa]